MTIGYIYVWGKGAPASCVSYLSSTWALVCKAYVVFKSLKSLMGMRHRLIVYCIYSLLMLGVCDYAASCWLVACFATHGIT
jgi:hypothetical protein